MLALSACGDDGGGGASAPVQLVHGYSEGRQYGASVAALADESFVVVWTSDEQDGNRAGLFGRRFSTTGDPLGTDFAVNEYTTGGQRTPRVAPLSNGGFVVVWSGYGKDGAPFYDLFGRVFEADGSAAGSEFAVNSYTTGHHDLPDVAPTADGGFVVVWAGMFSSAGHERDYPAIAGRTFASDGSATTDEFRVSDAIFLGEFPGSQGEPVVEAGADGDFVVVWSGAGPNETFYVHDSHLFAQRIDLSGAREGDRGTVADTDDVNEHPALAGDGASGFVVAWTACGQSYFTCEYGARVLATHLDAFGQPLVESTEVGNAKHFSDTVPALADSARDVRLVFLGATEPPHGPDPPEYDVFARSLKLDGKPLGKVERVNPSTPVPVGEAAIASNGSASFVIWTGDRGTYPVDTDVFARVTR